MNNRYYIGKRDDGNWEVFAHDSGDEPTAESTGYQEVQGPFDTEAEAQDMADA